MAEQSLDLRSTMSRLRRHRATLLGAAVLGASIGMTLAFLTPPMYASSSLVLLPPKTTDPNQAAEMVKTDLKVATSAAVLQPASRRLRPPMSLRTLAEHVEVTAATPLVLEITGLADDPERAEEISRVVANSEVAYVTQAASSIPSAKRTAMATREKELKATLEKVDTQIAETTARLQQGDANSSSGRADATALAKLTAQRSRLVLEANSVSGAIEALEPSGFASVIQKASPAERTGLIARYAIAGLAGLILALVITASLIVLLSRRDRRLHYRDDIADAIGSPVIASVHSRSTESVAGWLSLLHSYRPGTVDAWAWRQALRHLLPLEPPGQAARQGHTDKTTRLRSIVVITLSEDPRALAAGPQLATFAASIGLRTHLAGIQRHEDAAALWAACSSLEQSHDRVPNLWVDDLDARSQQLDLAVALVVLDRRDPQLTEIPDAAAVVLAVSAGSVTAEELARIAMTVDDAGASIRGIFVMDPDNLDRTTGRLLQHDRAQQAPLPSRLTGPPPMGPRRDDISALRRRSR